MIYRISTVAKYRVGDTEAGCLLTVPRGENQGQIIVIVILRTVPDPGVDRCQCERDPS